jgi:hypothetical protein
VKNQRFLKRFWTQIASYVFVIARCSLKRQIQNCQEDIVQVQFILKKRKENKEKKRKEQTYDWLITKSPGLICQDFKISSLSYFKIKWNL